MDWIGISGTFVPPQLQVQLSSVWTLSEFQKRRWVFCVKEKPVVKAWPLKVFVNQKEGEVHGVFEEKIGDALRVLAADGVLHMYIPETALGSVRLEKTCGWVTGRLTRSLAQLSEGLAGGGPFSSFSSFSSSCTSGARPLCIVPPLTVERKKDICDRVAAATLAEWHGKLLKSRPFLNGLAYALLALQKSAQDSHLQNPQEQVQESFRWLLRHTPSVHDWQSWSELISSFDPAIVIEKYALGDISPQLMETWKKSPHSKERNVLTYLRHWFALLLKSANWECEGLPQLLVAYLLQWFQKDIHKNNHDKKRLRDDAAKTLSQAFLNHPAKTQECSEWSLGQWNAVLAAVANVLPCLRHPILRLWTTLPRRDRSRLFTPRLMSPFKSQLVITWCRKSHSRSVHWSKRKRFTPSDDTPTFSTSPYFAPGPHFPPRMTQGWAAFAKCCDQVIWEVYQAPASSSAPSEVEYVRLKVHGDSRPTAGVGQVAFKLVADSQILGNLGAWLTCFPKCKREVLLSSALGCGSATLIRYAEGNLVLEGFLQPSWGTLFAFALDALGYPHSGLGSSERSAASFWPVVTRTLLKAVPLLSDLARITKELQDCGLEEKQRDAEDLVVWMRKGNPLGEFVTQLSLSLDKLHKPNVQKGLEKTALQLFHTLCDLPFSETKRSIMKFMAWYYRDCYSDLPERVFGLYLFLETMWTWRPRPGSDIVLEHLKNPGHPLLRKMSRHEWESLMDLEGWDQREGLGGRLEELKHLWIDASL